MAACLFAIVGIVHFAAAYSPIIEGALADVRIKVVDDMGEAVPDATISVKLPGGVVVVQLQAGQPLPPVLAMTTFSNLVEVGGRDFHAILPNLNYELGFRPTNTATNTAPGMGTVPLEGTKDCCCGSGTGVAASGPWYRNLTEILPIRQRITNKANQA